MSFSFFYFRLSGYGCLAMGVWLWLSGYGCLAMAVWLWVSGYGCQAMGVWLWLSGYGCLAMAVWLWLSGYGCLAMAVWLWVSGLIWDVIYKLPCDNILIKVGIYQMCRDRRGCDGMVVGLTTAYSTSEYHHCHL